MYLILDLETTGRTPYTNEILSLAAIKCSEQLEIINTLEIYKRPDTEATWEEEAENVHKISLREARAFSSTKDFNNSLYDFLGEDTYHLVFHSARFPFLFDYCFLRAHYDIHNDVFAFYKKFPEYTSTVHKRPTYARKVYGVENQKLSTYAKKLGIKFNHHQAMDDTKVCLEVFKYQRMIDAREGSGEFFFATQ